MINLLFHYAAVTSARSIVAADLHGAARSLSRFGSKAVRCRWVRKHRPPNRTLWRESQIASIAALVKRLWHRRTPTPIGTYRNQVFVLPLVIDPPRIGHVIWIAYIRLILVVGRKEKLLEKVYSSHEGEQDH